MEANTKTKANAETPRRTADECVLKWNAALSVKPFRLTPPCKVYNEDRENVGCFICAATQTQSHHNRSRAARAKIWRTHWAFSKAVRFLQVWHMLFCFYFTLSFGRVCLSSLQNLQSIINCEIYVLNSSDTFHRQHTEVFFQLASTIQLRLLTLTLTRRASQQPSGVWYEADTNENHLEERKKFKKKTDRRCLPRSCRWSCWLAARTSGCLTWGRSSLRTRPGPDPSAGE